jgi:hypothetical protein
MTTAQFEMKFLFRALSIAIGVAHFIFPQLARRFWIFWYFPSGVDPDYDEPSWACRLIGLIFFVAAAIVAFDVN